MVRLTAMIGVSTIRTTCLSALLVTILLSCDRGSDQARQATSALARQWSSKAPPGSRVVEAPTNAGTPILVLDASRSMAGFAGCSAAPTEFNTLIDHLSADLGVDSVTRFGEVVAGAGHAFDTLPLTHAVHCPAFFDRLQNPDSAVFDRAAADSTHVYLYITDGVQSDARGPNPGPSVGLLKSRLARGEALAIIALRSRFAGPLWSEQRQRMLGSVRSERRPFYVFVLAPSDAGIDALLRSVSSATLSNAKIMRFGPGTVQCRVALGQSANAYDSNQDPPWAFLHSADLGNASDLLDYDCRISEEFPLGSVTPVASAEYRRWLGREFGQPSAPPTGFGFTPGPVKVQGEHVVVPMKASLPTDPQTRFGFYGVRVDPTPGALKPWVADLSTDTDASPDDIDKTYRLSWLIEQLARVRLAREPWSPFSLTLQYR